MGISERKERQKAELRETILAAARRIFIAEGAEALTMRRIAEVIEYSPGTIYLYFASREEIAFHLVREGFAKLLAAFGSAQAVADPIERIRSFGQAYVAFGLADPETYKLIFMTDAKYAYAALAPNDVAIGDDPGQRAFDLLVGAIEEAVDAGRFRAVDAESAAQAFVAGLHGVLSLHITCSIMIPDAARVAELVEEAMIKGFSA